MEIGGTISGALFEGADHKYRYSLWRIWDKTKPTLFFIGLNPSTAGRIKDDPTIIMPVTLAKNLGFGGLYAGILFSIVSSDPRILLLPSSQELPGGANDSALRQMRDLTSKALVGWGEWASLYTTANGRALEVLRIIGVTVY